MSTIQDHANLDVSYFTYNIDNLFFFFLINLAGALSVNIFKYSVFGLLNFSIVFLFLLLDLFLFFIFFYFALNLVFLEHCGLNLDR